MTCLKKYLKKEISWSILTFILLVFIHIPILSKHLLTADIILNNATYRGYSWELSLGRFGLYIFGILKGFKTIPMIEYLISCLLISATIFLWNRIFSIKSSFIKSILVLLVVVSPMISASLLFYYCSTPYMFSLFCSVYALYAFVFYKKKVLKYALPMILIMFSLSIYQAYLSVIGSIFIFYLLDKLLKNKPIKKELSYLFLIGGGVALYYLMMKLSLIVFHIPMSHYQNANKIGLSAILKLKDNFFLTYQVFYQYFFTDKVLKNSFFHNQYLYIGLFFLWIIEVLFQIKKNKVENKRILLIALLILFLPCFLNMVTFVISDSKLQLLMSLSYLIFFLFIGTTTNQKIGKMVLLLFTIILSVHYLIEDQASYLSIEKTNTAYQNMIQSMGLEKDKQYIVIGNMENRGKIYQMNYGFVADEGLFWEEYHLRKLGFERYTEQIFHKKLSFASEEKYRRYQKNDSKEVIREEEGIIILDLRQIKN